MNYIATTIRREDNSVVVVPNQVFSKGEIINWSRTPYRLFKTTVSVKMTDCSMLGKSQLHSKGHFSILFLSISSSKMRKSILNIF